MSHSIANVLLLYFCWSIGALDYDVQCFCYVKALVLDRLG